MSALALFTLGLPRLEQDGRSVEIERHKALALLTYLAVTGAAHRRDELAAFLWPDLDHTRARAALRRTLSTLNLALGSGWLEADRETIELPEGLWLDVGQFRTGLAQCRKHGHPDTVVCAECLPALAQAAALYRGDFLSGFTLRDAPAFDEWQFFEAESLRRELASALERLARGHSERREFETAIRYARRWLALDLLHEPAHGQLMRLYAWAGQRTAALRQYAECVRLLERELGVPPQAATSELYAAIKENRLAPPSAEVQVAPRAPFAWTTGAVLHDRYRLEAELGRGGMGVVHRAHDVLLDRAVAIKVLNESGIGTEGRARLLREAQAVAKLDHPHIVPVYDVGEIDGTPFIVMQLVVGQNLRQAGSLSVPQILTLASQLCDALSHAHQHGIVHRDVKPENIVVTSEGAAKLTDFGIAHSQNAPRLTQEGTLVGTLAYLAPEQIVGEAIDGRADLYAIGVILYELTTGRLPFTGGDVLSLISQHLHAPVEPPRTHRADLPAALDALIVRLLSKKPADRFQSAAEVRAVLDSLKRPAAVPPTLTAAYSMFDRIVGGQLVGRENELAAALALWSRAASGEGQVLLVSGEPGVGKTRLVRELLGLAQAAGARILTENCHAEGGPPYAPLAGVIRDTFENPAGLVLPEFILSDLLTLAPHLRAHHPQVPPNPPLGPAFEQQRLFDSFVGWCNILAASTPLLLLVEDVHWADGGTLALLRHLARRLRKARLLLVLTFRDTEVEADEAHPLHNLLLDLNRERLAETLRLARFSLDQTRALLTTLLSTAGAISPEFLESVYRETEGNPFFTEEVCKGLIEQGKLYEAGGTWRRADMQTIFIPSSVREAIFARVERLPAPAQEVLRLAAVIGREFNFALLREASEQDEEALISALERAERAQLVTATARAGRILYSFVHALIPFALREGLNGLRRQRLHQRIAVATETQRPNDFEALAYHFAAAGERDKALAYLRQAADRAQALYAYDAAIQHLHTALALIDLDEQAETRLTLLETLADVHRLRGDHADALQVYQQALGVQSLMPNADKWLTVRLHRKMGETLNRLTTGADLERFNAMVLSGFESALRLIQDEPPQLESVRLLTTLGNYAYWSGFQKYAQAEVVAGKGEHYAQAAVSMAEQLDAPVELSAALEALANGYSARGLIGERRQVALRQLALSRDPRFTDKRGQASILCQVGTALCSVGDYLQALTYLLEAERLADEIRDSDGVIQALGMQVQCYFGLDRWEEILQVEDKRLAFQARYGSDRIGRICRQCGVSAFAYGRRGEMELARSFREEVYNNHTRLWGPLENWPLIGHY